MMSANIDSKTRKAVYRRDGYRCALCDDTRGLQVHHVVPLHQTAAEHVVDPVRDLIPVCPNCHVALHAKPDGGTYTPDELRILMGLARGSR